MSIGGIFMSKSRFKERSPKPVTYLIGAAVGVFITLILMLASAAIVLLFNLDRDYCAPLGTVSLALGSFAAAYYVSKKSESRGYIIGALTGLVSFAAVTVISLIVNKSGLTLNTLFHFIIIVLASAIGGILGVNRGKNKKYI